MQFSRISPGDPFTHFDDERDTFAGYVKTVPSVVGASGFFNAVSTESGELHSFRDDEPVLVDPHENQQAFDPRANHVLFYTTGWEGEWNWYSGTGEQVEAFIEREDSRSSFDMHYAVVKGRLVRKPSDRKHFRIEE